MSKKDIVALIITILNMLLAVIFCITFFLILKDMPNNVPVHWSAGGGIDKFGSKTTLYPLGIIPIVTASIASIISLVAINKKAPWISYLANGISCFLSICMICAALLMFSNI